MAGTGYLAGPVERAMDPQPGLGNCLAFLIVASDFVPIGFVSALTELASVTIMRRPDCFTMVQIRFIKLCYLKLGAQKKGLERPLIRGSVY